MTQKEPSSSAFKKWLDLLQQESWQLELLISGFSILGLFQFREPLIERIALVQSEEKMIVSILLAGVFFAIGICIINLCIHVILRGLWVGALGLRYVSGEIEFDELKYHKWFDRFLRKRIKSFDHFIGRLENYCSIMFAIAFLSIFFILSLFIVMGLIGLIATSLESSDNPVWLEFLGGTFIFILLVSMLLTFLDFLTLGFFKRKKWIAVWYYPVYRFYSIISLSFLYRALVYNFLDSKFSRRIFMLLTPIYVAIMFITSVQYQGSNYFITYNDSTQLKKESPYFAVRGNYEDELIEKKYLVSDLAIPSKQISENFLPIFIPYKEGVEEDLLEIYPELKVEDDIKGIAMKGIVNIGQDIDSATKARIPFYISKLNEFYDIKLDSVSKEVSFVITRNRKKQLGFESVIDLYGLSRGKHILNVSRKDIKVIRIPKEERTDPEVRTRDSIIDRKVAAIPFWYYPN